MSEAIPWRRLWPDEPNRTDLHGPEVTWPSGPGDFPYHGPVNQLRERPTVPGVVSRFRSRTFRLWVDEDKTAFDEVMERAHNGLFSIQHRIDRWSDEYGGLIVWMEWLQHYNIDGTVK